MHPHSSHIKTLGLLYVQHMDVHSWMHNFIQVYRVTFTDLFIPRAALLPVCAVSSSLITPHISPSTMPGFRNPDGGMSVTIPSFCILVVQLQAAIVLETCWATNTHLSSSSSSSSSPHYTGY